MKKKPTIQEFMAALQVGTTEECEKADFVVCLTATPDNQQYKANGSIEVPCDGCGAMLMLHPTSPVKPRKLCLGCATECLEDSQSLSE